MDKFEDLFGKKKEAVPVLDLSKSTASTKEEFKKLIEKVPDFKIRSVKVRPEEIKIKEKECKEFKLSRKELRFLKNSQGEREKQYTYMDPVPSEMRSIVIMEICAVPIDWKMLTTQRPKLKIDENYFDRLIEMGKLQIKTEAMDKKVNAPVNTVRKFKNKAGVIETRIITCAECGEEFCLGNSCGEFNYDLFARVPIKIEKKKTNEHGSNKSTTSIIAKLMGTDKDKMKTSNSDKLKRRPRRRKSPVKKKENGEKI
ncbi:CLUMA_CG009120, isoform A [Clunio marinus]|uniref:CLUMA_CG009120, isoform A n=1 Tax=Clunio marinus TaxID=568069 RepID=A0A1J1I9L7_9DIPT|nr:CLUMA_CG009120, isoform A [Clunio marinus]